MAKDRDGNIIPDYDQSQYWDASTGSYTDPNIGKEEGANNVSLLTGKTWDQMTDIERNAHKIMRGNSDTLTDEQVASGQKWLGNNAGDSNDQMLLSIAMRDATQDRQEAGIFNYGPDGEGGARDLMADQLARQATYGDHYTYDPDGLNGGTGRSNPTLGVTNQDYFDPSGLTVGDESNQKVWNPNTNQYEYYVNDQAYQDAGGNRTWYTNELGDYGLGFRGGPVGTNQYGTQSFVDDANRLNAWIPTGDNNTNPTNPTNPVGPTNPADPYDPPTKTGNPENPTDDWFWTDPVGYENAPQPEGDGTFTDEQPPADTSWDWDAFRQKAPGDRQWGGYDKDYQAFERYQPGDRSPWGMPNIEGGNRDFYQQQFVNQLRDEQGYQNRERNAQELRQFADDNPYEAPPTDWSFANKGKGIRDVQMGSGRSEPAGYDINKAFRAGESTNADILRWASGNDGFSSDDRKWYSDHLNNPQWEGGGSKSWSSAGDPTKLISNLNDQIGEPDNFTQRNQRRMTELFNKLYNPGATGPMAPLGYASPIQWGSSYNDAPAAPAA